MAENTEIKSKFANAVFQSLLEHWDKVNPAAGSDRDKWDNGHIMAFALRYANEQSEDVLKEHAQNKDGKLSKPFEKRFLPDAAQQYLSYVIDAVPAAPRDGLNGFNRATGGYQPDPAPQPAVAEAPTVIVMPIIVPQAAPAPTAAPAPAPTEAAPVITPDLAALTRLAATSALTAAASRPTPQPVPELVLEPAEAPQDTAPMTEPENNVNAINPAQLSPQPADALDDSDDFSADSIITPGEDTQQITIPPTDWSQIRHIFYTTPEDMQRVDAVHALGKAAPGTPGVATRTKHRPSPSKEVEVAYSGVLPFTPESMAYLAVRYPSYERDPLFLKALHELAERNGKTVDELLQSDQVRVQGENGGQPVDTKKALFDTHQKNSLLTTPPFADFKREIVQYGMQPKSRFKQTFSDIDPNNSLLTQYKKADLMFVDKIGNAYVNTGLGVTFLPAPGESFGIEHAFNITRITMAGKFNPVAPTPQTMKLAFHGGDKLSRVFGHRGIDGQKVSLLVLSALSECARASNGNMQITPEISVEKLMGDVTVQRIWFEEQVQGGAQPGPNDIIINSTAREMMSMHVNVDELVRNFNARLDSPAPAPTPAPVTDFTDVGSIAKAGIGKLTEMVMGTDLSQQINRTVELQAEMMAIDKVMQDRHDSPEYRKAFIDHYSGNPEDGREKIKDTFTGEEIEAANTALHENLNNIQNLKGPGNSVVPTFGTILQDVLIRSDAGTAPMDRDQVKKHFEAGAMLQFAARITQSLTTGSAHEYQYPREGAHDSKNVALVGQTFALLKNQLDNGKLDPRLASKLVQTDVKQMVREVQKTLNDFGDPRVASLGTLFVGALNSISSRYPAPAATSQSLQRRQVTP